MKGKHGFLFIVILAAVQLPAQEQALCPVDSLYLEALETVYQDTRVADEERSLLDLLARSQHLSPDEALHLEEAYVGSLPARLDQSGRWPVVAQNMVWGAGLYGWGIPEVLDAEDEKWYIGMEMFSLGISFALTQRYTRNMDIGYARAQMLRSGSVLGLRYGLGIGTALNLDDHEDDDGMVLLPMLGVPLGTWVGDRLWQRWQPDHGESWSLTLWSGVAASLTWNAYSALSGVPPRYLDEFDPIYPDEYLDNPEWDEWNQTAVLLELAGYPLGLWWGNRFNQSRDITFGDALMLTQGWGYGWLASYAVLDILIGEDKLGDDVFLLLGSAGAVGSIYLYDHWIRPYDYSFGQAFLEALGTGAGIMAGFGTAIITEIDEPKAMEALGLTGGILGARLTHRILKPELEQRREHGALPIELELTPLVVPHRGLVGLSLALSL